MRFEEDTPVVSLHVVGFSEDDLEDTGASDV